MTSRDKALRIAESLSDRKAEDVRIFELGELCSFADFFVIATGTSDRHVRSVAEAAQERGRELGERALGQEGAERARWILVDFGDVVLHVFSREARDFYALERLWSDAELLDPTAAAPSVA